jgi:citronellol/citronellal dehydrogenase
VATAMTSLAGRTMMISGGSRGVGLAIALRAAQDGANVCLLAKTAEPHPRLDGTIFTAADAIERAGGHALPVVGDVRHDRAVEAAVAQCIERFGGIDICVNNASVINVAGTIELPMKAYDLMQDVNVRGSFLLTKACLPHLIKAENPHVLMLSPPLNFDRKWLRLHIANTVAKYSMSMWALGMAEEFREQAVAFNGLWPRTYVATVAVRNVLGGDAALARSRRPEVMGDAAHAILVRSSRDCTGNLFIDDDVLRAEGVTDFARYRHGDAREEDLIPDFFI